MKEARTSEDGVCELITRKSLRNVRLEGLDDLTTRTVSRRTRKAMVTCLALGPVGRMAAKDTIKKMEQAHLEVETLN